MEYEDFTGIKLPWDCNEEEYREFWTPNVPVDINAMIPENWLGVTSQLNRVTDLTTLKEVLEYKAFINPIPSFEIKRSNRGYIKVDTNVE